MKPSRHLARALAAPVALAVLALGCDKASPVAPTGTTLSISASPSRIAASGEASAIRVTALRPNGTPVNPGTQVRLETTLGTVTEIIETDASGIARGELRGDGRIGTATVSARAGSTEAVTLEVDIGQFATSISLSANPSQVAQEGGNIGLLAVIRDDQARPLAGALVNFRSEVGSLASGGSLRASNSSGEVRDTLRVSVEDLLAFPATSFTVTAIVGASEGSTSTATATIRVASSRPLPDFIPRNDGENRVFFENTTQGSDDGLRFEWFFDNDSTVDSTEESPRHDFGSAGTYQIRLFAENRFGSSQITRSIIVPIQ